MIALSSVLILVGACVILIFAFLGGNALWWVSAGDAGYGLKLLRVLMLLLFLASEMVAPFVYKKYMESYFESPLSVKSQFITIAVIIPAAVILVYPIGGMFMSRATQDIVFYILAGAGLIGATVYTISKNIGSVGMKSGIVYTITSFLLCVSALVSLFYFFVALFMLIMEMMPLIAMGIGCLVVFSKSYGNAVMRRDSQGNYIANDGSKHSSESARNSRDAQIRAQQNQNK